MFTIQTFLPRITPSIRAIRIPDGVAVDVLGDDQAPFGPGDYLILDDNGAVARGMSASEFDGLYIPA